jgi:hypothetical protein
VKSSIKPTLDYTITPSLKIHKINSLFQILRNTPSLPNGHVTTIKIKLLKGYVFIFGVNPKNMTLIEKYIGEDTVSYGFWCEDGHIDTYSMKL